MRQRARLSSLERRLGERGREKKTLRFVTIHDGDPEPEAGPGEELFIVRIVKTITTGLGGVSLVMPRPGGAKPTNGEGDTTAALESEIRALER